jgi:hypothetical protein
VLETRPRNREPATQAAAGSISDRRAVSVSPKNGAALAVLPPARAVLLIRDIAPINEYGLGQRPDPCDLAADGRARLASRRFSGSRGGLTPNGARSETLPAPGQSRERRQRAVSSAAAVCSDVTHESQESWTRLVDLSDAATW